MKSCKATRAKGAHKYNVWKPVFCHGGHISSVSKHGEVCKITIFTRVRRKSIPFYLESKLHVM